MSKILFVDFQGHQPEKHYEGRREGHAVIVTVNDQPLNLRLEVCNHSPTGFEWGYIGSGPAQLALALLVDHCSDTEEALTLHQVFKQQVVAGLPYGGWMLTTKEITATLQTLPHPLRLDAGIAVRIRR
jgi:hypothetical protein